MFANDDVPLEHRYRLFNIYIAHELKERIILYEKDLSTGIFTYMINLQNDTACHGFRSHQEVVDWLHSHNCDYSLTGEVNDILTDTNPNKIKVGQLIIGPRGTPCFSAYGFEKEDISENSPILLGECPEQQVENPWFSQKILISRFMSVIQNSHNFELIEKTPTNHLFIGDMENEAFLPMYVPFDQIEHFYEVYLLAHDQYKQLQQSLKDTSHGTLLYVVDNYRILYPLIVHYQKKDDQYVWSFPEKNCVPTPYKI